MTTEEFRSNNELVAWLRSVTEHENFKMAQDAMRSIDPVRRPASPDVTPHGAHILLGEQTGWAQYEMELLKLATRMPMKQELPAPDYRDPNEEAEQPET